VGIVWAIERNEGMDEGREEGSDGTVNTFQKN
jgi:hypothetical protein